MPKKSPYPDIVIPDKPFHEYIYSHIREYENNVTIIENGTGISLTFDEIHLRSRKLAAALYKRGLKKGDVVGICAPSCVQYAVILLATSSCGAALTTCNPDYTEGEILHQFRQSKPVMTFAHMKAFGKIKRIREQLDFMTILPFEISTGFESLSELIERSDEKDYPSVVIDPKKDILLMPYSSGTSGLPKCVVHTHATIVASSEVLNRHCHIFKTSCYYSERPMFHAGGLDDLMKSFRSGCKLVTDSISDPGRMLKAIEKYKVTHTYFVTPIMVSISNNIEILEQYNLSSLKSVGCGSSFVPVSLMDTLGRKLNVTLQQGYGMTESLVSHSDPVMSFPGSAGIIMSNAQVKVIDISTGRELSENQNGEILVRAPYMMVEYFQNPEATAKAFDKDGWLHTGDIGHYNKDGMMFVTGRLKEVIKYRTFQVPPAEIEEVLLSHPKIADAAVVGVTDTEVGEIPRALVVRKDASLTKDDVMDLIDYVTTSIYGEECNLSKKYRNQLLEKSFVKN